MTTIVTNLKIAKIASLVAVDLDLLHSADHPP